MDSVHIAEQQSPDGTISKWWSPSLSPRWLCQCFHWLLGDNGWRVTPQPEMIPQWFWRQLQFVLDLA